MQLENLDKLRIELSLKSKNGIGFTLAASIIWLILVFLWKLDFKPYDKSIFVFITSGLMLPLAFLFSKLLKINWKIENNPLQPLGLWLNIAQLLYFPFLIFTMLKMPQYFIFTYAIITGGHLFPYAWLYKTNLYALFAFLIVLGSLVIGLILPTEKLYFVAQYVSILLFVLTIFLYFDINKKTEVEK